jgi:perosamine synthetase
MSLQSEFLLPKEPVLEPRFLKFRSNARTVNLLSSPSPRWSQARYAIYAVLKTLEITSGDEVLLPSYICAAAVEPVHASGAKSVFYRVTAGCEADVADIEMRITPRTRAVLIVHYFGFPNSSLLQLRDLCNRKGLALIEDCAHVLGTDADQLSLGQVGDAAIYSLRKFLPIPDGAVLRWNRESNSTSTSLRSEPWLSTMKHAVNLAEQVWPPMQTAADCARALVKGGRGRGDAGTDRKAIEVKEELVSPEVAFRTENIHLAMSPVSACIIQHTDLAEVAGLRIRNYRELSLRLRDVVGVRLLFEEVPSGICPWTLPLTIDDQPLPHQKMRELGIPAVGWDAVRPREVRPGEFPVADYLYNNVSFLPVHQSLTLPQIDTMVSAVGRVCRLSKRRSSVCTA